MIADYPDWPVDENGENKSIGEMSAEERDKVIAGCQLRQQAGVGSTTKAVDDFLDETMDIVEQRFRDGDVEDI